MNNIREYIEKNILENIDNEMFFISLKERISYLYFEDILNKYKFTIDSYYNNCERGYNYFLINVCYFLNLKKN